ncbi:2OG-Fe(II) oxygenase [Terricaulis sp.]|uniref:2OG-Fe(II) oxygenase n=1 Tax=Terricaulis sp. TaxID=2768686 RepID=UPI003782D6E3
MPRFRALHIGEPAPWFHARASTNPRYAFDTVGGRYAVLCFVNSAADPVCAEVVKAAYASPAFNDEHACFFTVCVDPADEREKRIAERLPGARVFWDFDGAISRLYGAWSDDGENAFRRLWVVLDPTLRIIDIRGFDDAAPDRLVAAVEALPPPARHAGTESFAPVLHLANVFEPELCQTLIAIYERNGGEESGFMRERDGKTVLAYDHAHKRRRDCLVEDPALIKTLQHRIQRRVVPEILKACQFHVTRMERYLVGCYTAEDGGHFRAHRDNTTKGTAHRRFAISVNLNADFEGGELSFPEYGPRSFKPPPGGAVVFSCSLLHAASKVTAGKRYAFLPFLYDDAAAELREKNNPHLGEGLGEYRNATQPN